jgi:pimeloyl-ACP methyl ester carboxylesterase
MYSGLRWFLITFLILMLWVIMQNFFIRKMIYPAPKITVHPPEHPLTEIKLVTPDKFMVYCWLDSSQGKESPFLLYFHGNGENIASLQFSGLFSQIEKLKVNSLVMDYPGYGESTGRSSEKTLIESADLAVSWIKKNFPQSKLIICGWSLGAAVAIQSAANNIELSDGLILLSPWSSLPAVASELFPPFLVKWVLKEKYDSINIAKLIDIPVLMIHGVDDSIIPIHHSRELAENFLVPPLQIEIPHAGHNDLLDHSIVWQEMSVFISDISTRGKN